MRLDAMVPAAAARADDDATANATRANAKDGPRFEAPDGHDEAVDAKAHPHHARKAHGLDAKDRDDDDSGDADDAPRAPRFTDVVAAATMADPRVKLLGLGMAPPPSGTGDAGDAGDPIDAATASTLLASATAPTSPTMETSPDATSLADAAAAAHASAATAPDANAKTSLASAAAASIARAAAAAVTSRPSTEHAPNLLAAVRRDAAPGTAPNAPIAPPASPSPRLERTATRPDTPVAKAQRADTARAPSRPDAPAAAARGAVAANDAREDRSSDQGSSKDPHAKDAPASPDGNPTVTDAKPATTTAVAFDVPLARPVAARAPSVNLDAAAGASADAVEERQSAAVTAVNHMTLKSATARGELDLPELGRVSVAAHAGADGLDVRVHAERATTAALLEAHAAPIEADVHRTTGQGTRVQIATDDARGRSDAAGHGHGDAQKYRSPAAADRDGLRSNAGAVAPPTSVTPGRVRIVL